MTDIFLEELPLKADMLSAVERARSMCCIRGEKAGYANARGRFSPICAGCTATALFVFLPIDRPKYRVFHKRLGVRRVVSDDAPGIGTQ